MKKHKIAIVYDWIDKWGGVERVLLTLHDLFPEAEFYTSYYDKESAAWAKEFKITTSFIQRLPPFIRKSRFLSVLLYPLAFESFNFSEYETVLSVTSSFAKGIVTKPQTKHICYLLTPPRYLWGNVDFYTNQGFLSRLGSAVFGNYLRRWDFIAAQRVDTFISISNVVAERCKECYKRESKVIYPPFDTEYWKAIKEKAEVKEVKGLPDKPYYLVVSRLEPYKCVDTAIKTFNTLNDKKLVVVGNGSQKKKLQGMAQENTVFLNNLSDEELAYVYSHATCLIMPQEEDFGYVALEAQFFGCPVISYTKSGTKETVLENKTGIFFQEQTPDALAKTLREFDIISSKLKESCLEQGEKNVERFSLEKFKTALEGYKF